MTVTEAWDADNDWPADQLDWWLQAACRPTSDMTVHQRRWLVGEFFPTDPTMVTSTAAARCAGCPVRAQCFEWAVGHELYGTWGGHSQASLERIRRRARIDVDRPEARLANRYAHARLQTDQQPDTEAANEEDPGWPQALGMRT